MQDGVGHRMVLDFLENGVVRLAVDGEVDDVAIRGEENLLEVLGLGSEMNLFVAAIKDARHQFGLTKGLRIFFPYVLAKRTAQ